MIRRVIAALLVLLATILAPFAVGAYWVQQTLMDAEQFQETIAPLAEDPNVKAVIEAEATTALIEALDIEQRLPDMLPPRLMEAIASGVNSAVSDAVERYVNGERFGTVWTRVTTRLQEGVVNLVEGGEDQGAVTLQEGQLVLNTTEVLTTVQEQLVSEGIPFIGSIDMTQHGRDIVLADTPNLQIAVDALSIFLPVARWLWVLVVAMLVAGILLWRPRSRGLLWAGIGLALGGAVTWFALDLGQTWLGESASTPQLGTLVRTVTETLVRFLANALLVMVALGLALAAAGWLGGGTRSGRRVRDAIRGQAHRLGAPWADGAVGNATARVPLLVPALRAVVIVGALWWAIAADPLRPATVAWILLTVGVLLFGVEILEGAGRDRDVQSSGAVSFDPALQGAPANGPSAAPAAAPWTGPAAPTPGPTTEATDTAVLDRPDQAPPAPEV